MAFYDASANMQQVDPLQSLMRGVQAGQQMQEMRRQQMMRQGLQKFMRPETPATYQASAPSLAELAANPGWSGNMVSGFQRTGLSPAEAVPTLTKTAEAQPASFDYQGAQDWLASQGDFTALAELAKAQKYTSPEMAEYGLNPQVGINPSTGQPEYFVSNKQGMPRFLGVGERPAAPKAPVTWGVTRGRTEYQYGLGADGQPVVLGTKQLDAPTKPEKVVGDNGQVYWLHPGQSLPSGVKAGGGAGAPTEDERKAAGWVAQARTALQNMQDALTEDPSADTPGLLEKGGELVGAEGAFQSGPRQRFTTAAGSFAEAALRAATGAGVNRDEAKQKINELTPRYFDKPETKQQKWRQLQMYIDSLEARAGRALQQQNSGGDQQKPGRDANRAAAYFKSRNISTQEQYNEAARALRKAGWSEADINAAADAAGL